MAQKNSASRQSAKIPAVQGSGQITDAAPVKAFAYRIAAIVSRRSGKLVDTANSSFGDHTVASTYGTISRPFDACCDNPDELQRSISGCEQIPSSIFTTSISVVGNDSKIFAISAGRMRQIELSLSSATWLRLCMRYNDNTFRSRTDKLKRSWI